MHSPPKRIRRLLVGTATAAALMATALIGLPSAAMATQGAATSLPDLQDGPEPTVHTQEAYAPEDDFTAKWTRADARQLQRLSDPSRPRARTRCRHHSPCPRCRRTSPTCRTSRSGCGTPGR